MGKHILVKNWLLYALLALALAFVRCTPERQLQRLKNRHPELFTKDTIIDTILVSGSRTDTLLQIRTLVSSRDTIVIREKQLLQKFFYNIHDSTVYLSGECLPDTIYRYIVQEVAKNIPEKVPWYERPRFFYLVIILGLILLIIILSRR